MQHHFVIFYDTDRKKWNVEFDTGAYFPDGHVWDDKLADEYGIGWMEPLWEDDEHNLDQELLNTLYSLVDVIPIPKEHENA